jgi:alkanesulfonate monooxygenase SsuD/methylene tetrahydromethanopterin reductase-like flavin-dependent oxidoreductase (luciferase family)
VAGVTEKSDTLTLAGERGYIPMSINFVPPRVLKTHWTSVEAGARQGGRVADRKTWRIARDVFIADTTAEARRQALTGNMARDWTGYFFPLLRKGRGLDVMKQDPAIPDSALTLEYLADNLWLIGDPDEVVRRIRALRDEVGDFGTLLVIGHEWEPREAWKRSMRLLVDEVLPRL